MTVRTTIVLGHQWSAMLPGTPGRSHGSQATLAVAVQQKRHANAMSLAWWQHIEDDSFDKLNKVTCVEGIRMFSRATVPVR